MDLFVWSDDAGEASRLELTYDKPHAEKSLVWTSPSHYTHCNLDDGGGSGQHPGTPIHRSDTPCDTDYLLRKFSANSGGIDPDIAALVERKIADYHGTRAVVQEPQAPKALYRWLLVSAAAVFFIAAILYWRGK